MRRIAAVLILAVVATPAFSFRFYPIVKDFAPAGPDSTQNFYVENSTSNRIAVQVSVVHRMMDEHGAEQYRDAEDEFLVYPSQMIVEPGARQTVRVQWLGGSDLRKELPYRIIAEQLPVEFERDGEAGSQIDIMFRYMGAVYIVPEGATADVSVVAAQVVSVDGGRRLRITLSNGGTAHTILRDLEIEIVREGEDLVLSGDDLTGMEGENLLADSRREFEIDLPRPLDEGPVRAEITFSQTR